MTNRRDFLKNTSAATLAAMTAGAPLTTMLGSCNRKKTNAKADSVILLWMAGGFGRGRVLELRECPRVEGGYVISVIRFRPRIPRIPQASREASRFREATWLLAGCSRHVQRPVCDVALAARRSSSHVRQ